jgi:hypothetical protein
LINAGTFDSYLWNTGDTTSTINIDSTALGIGTFNYSVIITDVNNCAATDSISVTYEALPISLLTDTATICGENNTLLLDAGANSSYNYLWSDGSNLSSLNVDTLVLGSSMDYIFVTLTSPAGCTKSDSSFVYFREIPIINIGNDTTICWTQNINLDAGVGYSSYLWSTGATSQTINLDSFDFVIGNNTYSVEVSNAVNCSNTDTMVLFIDPCLGIPNYDKKDISVTLYPNPNKGVFNIEITTKENKNILLDVFNSQGKLIVNDKFSTVGNYQQKVDLRMLAKGIYYVRLLSDHQVIYYGKVIVN